LYYSQDDARKFQWLIRQQKQQKSKNKKDSNTNVEHKLQSLEQMVQYCTTPTCRRNALIRHFGGTPVECQGTCDFCKDPKKMERVIQSAAVIKDVKQPFLKNKVDTPWNGQWNGPHDDDKDWGIDDGMVGDLRVTGPLGGVQNSGDYDKPSSTKKLGGFTKASSILAKYEVSFVLFGLLEGKIIWNLTNIFLLCVRYWNAKKTMALFGFVPKSSSPNSFRW
jgi:hypothetical protein